MIHEFEEIVFMKWWIRKNSESILLKFPRLGERIIQQQKSLSTEQFTLIVAEEFIIVFLILEHNAGFKPAIFRFAIDCLNHLANCA